MSAKKVCACAKGGDGATPVLISVGTCPTCGTKNVLPDKQNVQIVLCPHGNKDKKADQDSKPNEPICPLGSLSNCKVVESIAKLLATSKSEPDTNKAKLKVAPNSDKLPIVCPRYYGKGCALEISVLEKHENNCTFKKKSNAGRTSDDKVGDYEVVGRLVYKTCGPDKSGNSGEKEETEVEVAQGFEFIDFTKIYLPQNQMRSDFILEARHVSSQTKKDGVSTISVQTPVLQTNAINTDVDDAFFALMDTFKAKSSTSGEMLPSEPKPNYNNKNNQKYETLDSTAPLKNVVINSDGSYKSVDSQKLDYDSGSNYKSSSYSDKSKYYDSQTNSSCHELPMTKIDVTEQKIRVYGDTIQWKTS